MSSTLHIYWNWFCCIYQKKCIFAEIIIRFSIDGEDIVNVINGKSTSSYTDVRYNNNTQTILSNNEPILTITLLRSDVIDCDINERLEILNELSSWLVNKLSKC